MKKKYAYYILLDLIVTSYSSDEFDKVGWDSPYEIPDNNTINHLFNNDMISEPIVIGKNHFDNLI
jgi:hypothetical protein